MKKTKWIAALAAGALALLAAGCDNGFRDAALNAMLSNAEQKPEQNDSGDWQIENGVLTEYLGNETEVKIPNRVTSIGDYAFSGCTSLTGVKIPDSVTSIGEHAFEWCSSLTEVTIGDGVTSIGKWAFNGCYDLTTVRYDGTKEEWERIEGISESGLASKTITFAK